MTFLKIYVLWLTSTSRRKRNISRPKERKEISKVYKKQEKEADKNRTTTLPQNETFRQWK